MTLKELFQDKSIKAKAKAKHICEWLIKGELSIGELLLFTDNLSLVHKATCIEGIECCSKKSIEIADESLLKYLTKALTYEESRVKWESAKAIGNIAKKFPNSLSQTTENLLNNCKNNGTVVRWATAYALGEILMLKPDNHNYLLPKIEALSIEEKDNAVKNKYLDALKKVKKNIEVSNYK